MAHRQVQRSAGCGDLASRYHLPCLRTFGMVLFSLIERAAQELACVRDSSFAISIHKMKARQSRKILEIGEALVATGLPSLDAQAAALGLPRSTTYTIVSAEHKSTGISA